MWLEDAFMKPQGTFENNTSPVWLLNMFSRLCGQLECENVIEVCIVVDYLPINQEWANCLSRLDRRPSWYIFLNIKIRFVCIHNQAFPILNVCKKTFLMFGDALLRNRAATPAFYISGELGGRLWREVFVEGAQWEYNTMDCTLLNWVFPAWELIFLVWRAVIILGRLLVGLDPQLRS